MCRRCAVRKRRSGCILSIERRFGNSMARADKGTERRQMAGTKK